MKIPNTDPIKNDLLYQQFTLAQLLSEYAYSPVGTAPEWSDKDLHTEIEWFESRSTGTQGFIVVDHKIRQIKIAFCGTQGFLNPKGMKDWTTNARICKATMGAIQIHRGVRNAIRSVIPVLRSTLDKFRAYEVFLTGHSLGGMCAAGANVWIKAVYPSRRVVTVTFGAGKIATTAAMNEAINNPFVRFQNGSDAIPRRPNLPALFGHGTNTNFTLIYFPNHPSLGPYLVNPPMRFRAADRVMTYMERLHDHDITDYGKALKEAKQCCE